jgi:hypothetical protein
LLDEASPADASEAFDRGAIDDYASPLGLRALGNDLQNAPGLLLGALAFRYLADTFVLKNAFSRLRTSVEDVLASSMMSDV